MPRVLCFSHVHGRGCPNHALNGEGKRCVSFRYDAEQKMLLSQMMNTAKRGAGQNEADA